MLIGEPIELLEVECRQCLEPFGPLLGEVDPNNAVVLLVANACDETSPIRTVDQAHDAVVAQQQLIGNLPDGGATRIAKAPHGQEQLVLRRGESCGLSLLLTPALEVAQPGPKGEQSSIGCVGQAHSCHDIISPRCILRLPETDTCRLT